MVRCLAVNLLSKTYFAWKWNINTRFHLRPFFYFPFFIIEKKNRTYFQKNYTYKVNRRCKVVPKRPVCVSIRNSVCNCMLYVEDDIRMLASERSHGMRTNVWGEQIRNMNSESILLVNICRHRTGGEVLCVCEIKFWEWWKCTSLGFCRLCKSRSLINQRRFSRYPCCLLLSLLSCCLFPFFFLSPFLCFRLLSLLPFTCFRLLSLLSCVRFPCLPLLPLPCYLFLSLFPCPCFLCLSLLSRFLSFSFIACSTFCFVVSFSSFSLSLLSCFLFLVVSSLAFCFFFPLFYC